MSSGSKRHHYIPCFYTKRWAAGAREPLCEFSRKHRDVKSRRTFPEGTGYKDYLYTITHAPADQAQAVEDVFFKRLDQRASDALDLMLAGKVAVLTAEKRLDWCRFINSLFHRHPLKIDWLRQSWRDGLNLTIEAHRADYDHLRRPQDPPTYNEFISSRYGTEWIEQQAARAIEQVVDSKIVCNAISGMRWATFQRQSANLEFVTSDRPVIISDGLQHPGSHIAIPISPMALFVAANSATIIDTLAATDPEVLVAAVNDQVIRQAHQYVYARDESHLGFIEERLGHQSPQMVGAPADVLADLAASLPASEATRTLLHGMIAKADP